jgi:hypothetical protein
LSAKHFIATPLRDAPIRDVVDPVAPVVDTSIR